MIKAKLSKINFDFGLIANTRVSRAYYINGELIPYLERLLKQVLKVPLKIRCGVPLTPFENCILADYRKLKF
jgi:hypothetical protein